MRILVLGCGSIGSRHLRNLAALGGNELGAYDPQPGAREAAAHDLGALESAWAWEPQVVLVTSPTSLHAEHALAALRHGCDVFVEKPLAASLDGLDELVAEASARDAVTMVGCNLRFHWGVTAMKRVVESGRLGALVTSRIEFGQWLPDWRPASDYLESYSAKREMGGGIVLDAIHEIDYALWLFGDPTETVGIAGQLGGLGIETEDTADLVMRFPGGPIASVHVDYVQRAYARSCKIAGTLGTAIWDWSAGTVSEYLVSTGEWEVSSEPKDYDKNEMYVEELRCFLGCVKDRTETPNPIAAARRTLEVALSVERG